MMKSSPVKAVLTALMMCAVLSPVAPCFADSGPIRVKLEVIGDWRINREVESFLETYIASCEGVEVVDSAPRVYIHVIARGIDTNKGRRLGYVMASASSEIMEMVLDSGRERVITDYNGLWMETGPDLRKLCEQCAVAIDAGVFDKYRAEVVSAGPGTEEER
ncbi:MAG: hypothetical protein GF408_08475 [Candidatus Omnitrophica bacterium]|nr:hypothetical protein [Candidatus Omnitrophota bacterium]